MRIYHDFEYSASYSEIANEFTENDSEYQAKTLNVIGTQFKKWVEDKTRTATYIQIFEISEQLDDNGKWFIDTLSEFAQGERSEDEV